MSVIKIPSYFQPFTEWQTELPVNGTTVGESLQQLFNRFPNLWPHFYTHWGILSANIIIYLNEDEIFTLQGMETPMKDTDRIILVPTSSGG
jgi:sulfur-carrier protein